MTYIPQEGSKTLGYLEDSPGKGQAMPAEDTVERSENNKEEDLKTSTSGMDADLQEWCLLPEVSLPFVHLDASDGSISPLDNDCDGGAQEAYTIRALDQESFVQGLSYCRRSQENP